MLRQTESFYQTSSLFSKVVCSNQQSLFDIVCDHEMMLIFLPDATSKFSVEKLEDIQKNQKELLKLNVVPVVIFMKGDSEELVFWFKKLLTKVIYVTSNQELIKNNFETKEDCCSIYHIRELNTVKFIHVSENDQKIDFKIFTINPHERAKKDKYRSVVWGRTSKRDTKSRFSYTCHFEVFVEKEVVLIEGTPRIRDFTELSPTSSPIKLLNQLKRKSQQERQERNNESKLVNQIKRKSQKLLKSITPQYDSTISQNSSNCDDDENQLENKLSTVELTGIKKLSLEDILNEPIYFEFIKAFSSMEYASESFIFYEEVNILKSIIEFEERKRFVEDMIGLFITPNTDSVLELNISQIDRENLYNKFHLQKENKKIEDDIFSDLVKVIVKYSIEDTYTRFILSDLYKQMMAINLSL
eukprot:gene9975-2293_t